MLDYGRKSEFPLEDGVALMLIPLIDLRPHEHIKKELVTDLARSIANVQAFTTPIVVCRDSYVILDGHHRYTAMKYVLNASHIPAYAIDYGNEDLCQVSSWINGDHVKKGDVIQAGLSSKLMPAKRSKHSFSFRQCLLDIPIGQLTTVEA